jgi:hypothetical protein
MRYFLDLPSNLPGIKPEEKNLLLENILYGQ